MVPTIVIDFKNLTFGVPRRAEVDICGGHPYDLLESWKAILEALATLKCKLIFFGDVITPMWKAEEWMKRQDHILKLNEEFYRKIENKMHLEDILRNTKSLNASYYEMWQIAKDYGDLHFSVENDNDLEIAYHARQNNAIAVISNDSDFLIYEGTWKLWGLEDNQITELTAIEFDKENLLGPKLDLPRNRMPLFATLAGNDFTKNHQFLKKLHDQLNEQGANHLNVRKICYFFGSIAGYVRSLPFVDGAFDIRQVATKAFGKENIKKNRQLIERSVNSYNLDRALKAMNDPIGIQLKNFSLYQSYLALTYPVVGIPMPFYDMRGRRNGTSLTNLILEWTSRKKGVLLINRHKPKDFTLLAKREFDENFTKSRENIIYPECMFDFLLLFFPNNLNRMFEYILKCNFLLLIIHI